MPNRRKQVFSGTDLSGMFEQYQKQPILSFCQMNEAVILSNRAQFLVYTYVFVGYHSKCLCFKSKISDTAFVLRTVVSCSSCFSGHINTDQHFCNGNTQKKSRKEIPHIRPANGKRPRLQGNSHNEQQDTVQDVLRLLYCMFP